MTIIIPQGASTYGDSTRTCGDAVGRKYVLAQFRSDSNLDWVRELRSELVVDELKFKHFIHHEPKLRTNKLLWQRIENGLSQASIIVIDTDEVHNSVVCKAFDDGADIMDLEHNIEGLVDQCSIAMIGRTPIAYLPLNLARVVPWRGLQFEESLDSFTPENIKKALGGGLRGAQVFAARAHAVFDLATDDDDAMYTDDLFRSPAASVLLAEILATPRTFDTEMPGTLPLLNRASEEIAQALKTRLDLTQLNQDQPLIVEADSSDIDEMQAADIAAGWARELLERGDSRSLGARFHRVWVNGRRIR